jgi:hypothetical protein
MTIGVWLRAILLILFWVLVLVLSRLPAAKRAAILPVFGSAVRQLIRRFRKAESARTDDAPESRDLIERNQDLIAKRLFEIGPSSDVHHVENQVRFCIADIAGREGKPHFAPEHEWLSQWEQRPNIPAEYRELKQHLVGLFATRHQEMLALRQQQELAERKRLEDLKREELVARNRDLIDKFLEIAERKVSIIDDYGDENWKILPYEIITCLRKIGEREGVRFNWGQYARDKRAMLTGADMPSIRLFGQRRLTLRTLGDEYEWLEKELEDRFRRFHEEAKSKLSKEIGFRRPSGEEFEAQIAKLLRSRGYDVAGTPKSGDQGADLIAKRGGRTIVIQAKHYQGSVGNNAVQEVISALQYYGGDEGWVVTNSTFTASAKALAQKAKIRLIDGRALQTEQL